MKKLKRHIDWDTMYDDLYYGVIKVEGDCIRKKYVFPSWGSDVVSPP